MRAAVAASVEATFGSAEAIRGVLGDVTLPDDLSSWLGRLTLL